MGAGGSVGQRGPLEEVTRILEAGGFAAPQGDGSAQEEQLIQFLKLVNAAGLSTVPVVKAEIDQMELPPGALAGGTGEFAAEEAAPVAINNAGEKLARFQAFLKEKFPHRSSLEASDSYALAWLGYMRSFEVVLAAWDEGVFVEMMPGFALPFAGLIACIE